MTRLVLFGAFESCEIRWNQDLINPYWVGKDVCDALAIANPWDALSGLEDDERDDLGIPDAIGRIQKSIIINEAGLYRLIFKSRTEKAKQFQRWVFREVLPSIRATGTYSLQPSAPTIAPSDSRLAQLESDIQQGLSLIEKGRAKVWEAVAQIRTEKVWQDGGFKNFEEYCKKRWGWEKSNAFEIAAAGKVIKQLKQLGVEDKDLPTAVSQVRPLIRLEPVEQVKAWKKVIEASAGTPTAKAVEAVAEPKHEPPKLKPAQAEASTDVVELKASIDNCHTWLHRAADALNKNDMNTAKYWITIVCSRLDRYRDDICEQG